MHDRRDPDTFTGRAFLHSINTHINNASTMRATTFTATRRAGATTANHDALTRGYTPDALATWTAGEVRTGSTSAGTSIGNGSQVVLWRVDQQK